MTICFKKNNLKKIKLLNKMDGSVSECDCFVVEKQIIGLCQLVMRWDS